MRMIFIEASDGWVFIWPAAVEYHGGIIRPDHTCAGYISSCLARSLSSSTHGGGSLALGSVAIEEMEEGGCMLLGWLRP
jgi:hypothetical protein